MYASVVFIDWTAWDQSKHYSIGIVNYSEELIHFAFFFLNTNHACYMIW